MRYICLFSCTKLAFSFWGARFSSAINPGVRVPESPRTGARVVSDGMQRLWKAGFVMRGVPAHVMQSAMRVSVAEAMVWQTVSTAEPSPVWFTERRAHCFLSINPTNIPSEQRVRHAPRQKTGHVACNSRTSLIPEQSSGNEAQMKCSCLLATTCTSAVHFRSRDLRCWNANFWGHKHKLGEGIILGEEGIVPMTSGSEFANPSRHLPCKGFSFCMKFDFVMGLLLWASSAPQPHPLSGSQVHRFQIGPTSHQPSTQSSAGRKMKGKLLISRHRPISRHLPQCGLIDPRR